MKTLENTFTRGPSPSYSEEANSDNLESANAMQTETLKPRKTYDFYNCHSEQLQQKHYEDANDRLKHGRNTFAFWTIVIILFVLTIGNLLLTLTIIGVLHLGKGIHGMELIPEEDMIKFYGETDLDRIFSRNIGQFEGFVNEPVIIEGDDASVYVRMHHRNTQMVNRIIMEKTGVQFRGVNGFEINEPINGNSIFTTHRPHYNIPQGAETLLSKTNTASRIVSPIDKPLIITSSDNRIFIKGSQSIEMDSEYLYMQAENNIQINSTQSFIHLGGSTGIFLDINKVPIINSEMGLRSGSVQYKLCVCMPLGIVFRIALPRVHNGSKVSCAHFSGIYDPCLVN